MCLQVGAQAAEALERVAVRCVRDRVILGGTAVMLVAGELRA